MFNEYHSYNVKDGSMLPHDPYKSLWMREFCLISTLFPNGKANLAPYSWSQIFGNYKFMFVSGGNSHSGINLVRDKHAVVNGVSLDMMNMMNDCCWGFEEGESEFDELGIEKESSVLPGMPPRVKGAPWSWECSYIKHDRIVHPTLKSESIVFYLAVEYVHISKRILTDGMVDERKHHHVARLGYNDNYTISGDVNEVLGRLGNDQNIETSRNVIRLKRPRERPKKKYS